MPDSTARHRRSVRLPAHDYAGPGAYYVTLVTQDRLCIFGQLADGRMDLSPRGLIAEECWRLIPAHFPHVELGAFVLMPNHLHGILIFHEPHDKAATTMSPPVGATQWVAPTTGMGIRPRPNGPPRASLGAIIGAYKSSVTRLIVQQFGGVPRIWQRGYYEHIVRDDRDWDLICRYIESNVDRWPDDEENRTP